MLKNFCIRFVNGFCYSIGITVVIHLFVMVFVGEFPMLPEYMLHFNNEVSAYGMELILIGVMSGITSGGTIVFEAKKISLLAQSLIFLVIMLSAWIPVSCYAWGFHRYKTSMVSTLASIIVTYGICWGIQYRLCRQDIDAINAKLKEKKEA